MKSRRQDEKLDILCNLYLITLLIDINVNLDVKLFQVFEDLLVTMKD